MAIRNRDSRWGGAQARLAGLARLWERSRPWLWRDVLAPLAITRLALLLVGWFSRYFPASADYPIQAALARGWQFSPHRLLDIWGRWDSGWYLNIATNGYGLRGDLQAVQSNVGFLPLYPYLIKLLALLLPSGLRTRGGLLLVGVVISNLFLLGALILLHRLVASLRGDEETAGRTVAYLLLFPTSFFFSCAYTESVYLFFSVAAFWAASKQRWGVAGLMGGFSALTRPVGVLILMPLVWQYLDARAWRVRRMRWDAGWLLLVPAGLLTFLWGVYPVTRSLLAPLQTQAAWDKAWNSPWATWLHPTGVSQFITPVDQACAIGFLALAVVALWRLSSASLGLYTLLLILPPLFSGTLASMARYCAVAFPAMVALAWLSQRRWVDGLVRGVFFTFQVLLMVAWSQFYWVG